VRRLRHGELLSLVAAAGLLVLLGMEWFDGEGSGYGSLGIVLVVLLLALAGLGIALVVVTVRGRPVAWPVAAAVGLSFFGILLFPVLLLRMTVFGPGDGEIQLAGWLGLLAALLLPLGGWLTMDDERRDAPESAYEPPPARPVPGTPS